MREHCILKLPLEDFPIIITNDKNGEDDASEQINTAQEVCGILLKMLYKFIYIYKGINYS